MKDSIWSAIGVLMAMFAMAFTVTAGIALAVKTVFGCVL